MKFASFPFKILKFYPFFELEKWRIINLVLDVDLDEVKRTSSRMFALKDCVFISRRVFREKWLNFKTLFIFNSDILRIPCACWQFVSRNISSKHISQEISSRWYGIECYPCLFRVRIIHGCRYKRSDVETNWIACVGWERGKSTENGIFKVKALTSRKT